MAALITSTAGLEIPVCGQIAAGLTGPLKAAPGFRPHAACPADGGFAVTGVRDSAEDHRAFFGSAVEPGMPDGVPVTVGVTGRRNAFTA
jgi:hypothetical protein